MNLRRHTFKIHRWLGLVVSLQLLAWSVGGLYFTLFDIEAIHGTTDSTPQQQPAAIPPEGGTTATQAIATAIADGIDQNRVHSVMLLHRRGLLVWELRDSAHHAIALVSVNGGGLLPMVDEEEARKIALADFIHPASVIESRLIEADPPGEFRGRRLPAWRIDLDHSKAVHLYIDAISGKIVARRNRIWRIFDFFWMLHIMDYDEREDFHHPLLTSASILAVLTSLSGVMLWGWRLGASRA